MKKAIVFLILFLFVIVLARCSVEPVNSDTETDYNCNLYTGFEKEMCIGDEALNNRVLSTQTGDNGGM